MTCLGDGLIRGSINSVNKPAHGWARYWRRSGALVLCIGAAWSGGCVSHRNDPSTLATDRDRLWLENERARQEDLSPWEREREDQMRRLHEDRARVARGD